ncbi:type II toxin-antitoxin system VapC family toxin [Lapillicoccus jejuensis]|uniref:Ribonuclease VapC n=1 Tax=Lapillicoccus jejuensis TaxID=402171 RepID=A0A542E6X5_9MICO|nr:type II toxin-antitoxin system VapC family toxin [Lapillicoccus jejuensis]TQJ06965.1 ribonuclease VapC [Lapillicoccus jejuensis]TQJ11092.1 ribonuclease VapC [Lapillicoccus jejuensis]
MILDSSAIVAVLTGEPQRADIRRVARTASRLGISAGTLLEVGVVVDRRGQPLLSRRLDALLEEWQVEVHPVTESQARIGRAAYRDFGKGSGHPAGLNLGDCFSYALARETRRPLLFVGGDFVHTDVVDALA